MRKGYIDIGENQKEIVNIEKGNKNKNITGFKNDKKRREKIISKKTELAIKKIFKKCGVAKVNTEKMKNINNFDLSPDNNQTNIIKQISQ